MASLTNYATKTADGKLFFENYSEKIQKIHAETCKYYGMTYYRPLIMGGFGYDEMTHLCFTIDEHVKNGGEKTVEALSKLIHSSWVQTYTFWRDSKPYESSPLYIKPHSTFGDERRERLAKTRFENLEDDEKECYAVTATIYLKYGINGE